MQRSGATIPTYAGDWASESKAARTFGALDRRRC
jgi:hypothetical protein